MPVYYGIYWDNQHNLSLIPYCSMYYADDEIEADRRLRDISNNEDYYYTTDQTGSITYDYERPLLRVDLSREYTAHLIISLYPEFRNEDGPYTTVIFDSFDELYEFTQDNTYATELSVEEDGDFMKMYRDQLLLKRLSE